MNAKTFKYFMLSDFQNTVIYLYVVKCMVVSLYVFEITNKTVMIKSCYNTGYSL